MNEKHSVESVDLTELMRNPIILRIVSIINITSLSILEHLRIWLGSQGCELFDGKWSHNLRQDTGNRPLVHVVLTLIA